MPTLPHALRKRLILIAAAACLTLLASCSGGQAATPAVPASPAPVRDYWPTDGWRSDAPANRGLDAAALAGLRGQIEQDLPFLDSLLIVKDGYLVYEEYFNGYDADRQHSVHSVTKSVMSALFGIAQAEGSIADLDVTLGDMAKFGYLYLNRGQWDGQQVISRAWVNLSTSAQGDHALYVPSGETLPIDFYGYHWWTWKPDWFHGYASVHARGYGGQWINIFPDLDLIIVGTANSQVDSAGNDAQEAAIHAMIRDQLLPALDIVEVEGE